MMAVKFMLAFSGATAVFSLTSALIGAPRAMSPSFVAPYRAIVRTALGVIVCAVAGILFTLFAIS